MALVTVPNTFSDNQIIDDDLLNANFAALVNALSGIVDTEFFFSFSGSTPVLTLNQKGSGAILVLQTADVDKITINNTGQLVSTVATGTAPLIIASTTKVVNLNADLLDGHEAEEYLPKAGGTLTGFLTLHSSPTAALHAVNKQYVDTVVGGVFPSGTKLLFGSNPPTGWTRVNAGEDKCIKLAKSGETIGVTGGSWEITGLTVLDHALTIAELPVHDHSFSFAFINLADGVNQALDTIAETGLPNVVTTTPVGSGFGHSHEISHDSSWRPRFEIWAAATKD